ncbi:hypothetical protein NFI96_008015 [Prochilodus magdalenae]|nr:hypothetical protein NFI96_008015 [Prochilodus magdalenae]
MKEDRNRGKCLIAPAFLQGRGFIDELLELLSRIPQGVIHNGARMMSQGLFPGIRPLPISPISSRTAAVRSVLAGCRMRTDSEPSCDSPLVSSDPKEDHNYSFAKSSSSTPGEQAPHDCSQASFHGNEAGSDTEEDDKSKIKKEPKEWSVDALALAQAQHKKRQHLTKAKQRVASDTLPLKKRRTEKPPESDDEEMKEAAGSLLHLAGVRACLNNITNRTAKGQKEQKEYEGDVLCGNGRVLRAERRPLRRKWIPLSRCASKTCTNNLSSFELCARILVLEIIVVQLQRKSNTPDPKPGVVPGVLGLNFSGR